jgi:hypothetical protein
VKENYNLIFLVMSRWLLLSRSLTDGLTRSVWGL